MRKMYNAFYVVNIVFQSIFNLLFYIGISLLAAWIVTAKFGLPNWIYVPFILIGTISGIISMMKFIMTAMSSLESIEKSQRSKRKNNEQKK